MNKKTLSILVVVLILLIGGIAFAALGSNSSGSETAGPVDTKSDVATTEQTPSPDSPTQQVSGCEATDTPEITYADGEFSPACVKIKSGTAISWKNDSSREVQVGTDPHPSHSGNKEVSNGEFVLELAAGSTSESTLTTKGEHSYHDHLNPQARGTIIVE